MINQGTIRQACGVITGNPIQGNPVELVDCTPPVITPNVNGTLGNNGWTVTDDESAISSTIGCDPTLINTDTAGTTLTCEATSEGGTNSASVTIQRDATPPVVSVTGVEDGASYHVSAVPTAGCDTQDALSGVATRATINVSGGEGNGLGTFTATCDGGLDNAGNSGSASATYTVFNQAPDCTGVSGSVQTLWRPTTSSARFT